jgi:hypothetical protein
VVYMSIASKPLTFNWEGSIGEVEMTLFHLEITCW